MFSEKQAGYLAGALAGKMTTAQVIGVVGGVNTVPAVVGFVERYLDKPRHVETQCLADVHGNVVVVSKEAVLGEVRKAYTRLLEHIARYMVA